MTPRKKKLTPEQQAISDETYTWIEEEERRAAEEKRRSEVVLPYDPEILRRISQLPIELKHKTKPEEPLTPLTDTQREFYDLIRNEGPLTGPQIVRRLGGSESNFTSNMVPALKQHGIVNRRGLGYYHPDTYKPE